MAFVFSAVPLQNSNCPVLPYMTKNFPHRVCPLASHPRRRQRIPSSCSLQGKASSRDIGVPETIEDASPSAEDSGRHVSELRSEHLNAFFDADESMYQVRLANIFRLALQNFAVELGELQVGFSRLVGLDAPLRYTPPECLNFILDDDAVANREKERERRDGRVKTGFFVRKVYDITCNVLDLFFEGRPIPRFWFLETVARMPYFAYSSCLHLLSTLGWYRSPTLMNMHHAEELNEAYHLAVMESLGGDKRWRVRLAER